MLSIPTEGADADSRSPPARRSHRGRCQKQSRREEQCGSWVPRLWAVLSPGWQRLMRRQTREALAGWTTESMAALFRPQSNAARRDGGHAIAKQICAAYRPLPKETHRDDAPFPRRPKRGAPDQHVPAASSNSPGWRRSSASEAILGAGAIRPSGCGAHQPGTLAIPHRRPEIPTLPVLRLSASPARPRPKAA